MFFGWGATNCVRSDCALTCWKTAIWMTERRGEEEGDFMFGGGGGVDRTGRGLCVFIFIYGLFNDSFNSSFCVTSIAKAISE
jgi:hypothetical protein